MKCDHRFPSGHPCGRRTEIVRRRLLPFAGGGIVDGTLVAAFAYCPQHDPGPDDRPLFEAHELEDLDRRIAAQLAGRAEAA